MTPIENKIQELRAAGFECGPQIGIEAPLPNGGSFLSFTTGVTIYYHSSTGAHEVHGAILGAYIGQLGPLGKLGYPISDEYDDVVGNQISGKVSDFQFGSIFYNSTNGQTFSMQIGAVPTSDFEIIDGIDVSQFQGVVDWSEVTARTTVKFAYIRATDGTRTDSQFSTNWNDSSGHVLRGAYHFYRHSDSNQELQNQADHFFKISTVNGKLADLPPVIDVEELPPKTTSQTAISSLSSFLTHVESRCRTKPIIYTYPSFWVNRMGNSDAFAHTHHLWIANYGKSLVPGKTNSGFAARTTPPLVPGKWSEYSLWQNAVLPGLKGISTLVDRNTAIVPSGNSLQEFLLRQP
ncbi:MAG: hypothetical protein KF722_16000 [Nitrospira sp.]|nr:hypothetical protein [Nitrospira sp.]